MNQILHNCIIRPIAVLCFSAFAIASLFSFSTTAHAQPSGGTAVSFATKDDSGNSLELRGVLWVPSTPARGAVVLVHGSGGWTDHREGHYGRALSAAGYAALAIDAFGPRGIKKTTEDQSQISQLQMTRDAFSARRFLLERGYAADRMAVMGFSKGGTVALYAADRNLLPTEADRFPVAISFYPSCSMRPRTPNRPVSYSWRSARKMTTQASNPVRTLQMTSKMRAGRSRSRSTPTHRTRSTDTRQTPE